MSNNITKNIFFSIGIGYLFAELQVFLETDFLIEFLKNNLISLLVALIAINSTTLSLVLTKIREISDKNKNQLDFSNTRKQMILSINEQIVLIIFSTIFLMVLDSIFIKNHQEFSVLIHTLIISTFVYALIVLFDTAKSVFIILDYKND